MRPLRVDRPPTIALLLGVAIPIASGCGPEADGPTAPPALAPGEPVPADLVDDGPDAPRPGKSPTPPPAPTAEPPGDEEMAAMSASELVEHARLVLTPDRRLPLLEAALEKEPGHAAALLMLAEAAERKGIALAMQDGRRDESMPYLYRAAEAARDYRGQGKELTPNQRTFFAMVFYNEACNLALDGQPDRAIESLREALALGFSDPIIHTDAELDTLRDRDDFRGLERQVPDEADAPADATRPGPEAG